MEKIHGTGAWLALPELAHIVQKGREALLPLCGRQLAKLLLRGGFARWRDGGRHARSVHSTKVMRDQCQGGHDEGITVRSSCGKPFRDVDEQGWTKKDMFLVMFSVDRFYMPTTLIINVVAEGRFELPTKGL